MNRNSLSALFTLLVITITAFPPTVFADTKIFEREYVYEAGEIDSKVSCRILALEQVKRLLLEELGTALMSETVVTNGRLTKDEIVTFAGGIVKTIIVEEIWDGKSYRLKARMVADPEEVAEYIKEVLGDQKKAKELAGDSKQTRELTKEIETLKAEIRVKPDNEKLKQYEEAVANLTTFELLKNAFEMVGRLDEDESGKFKDNTKLREAIDALDKVVSRIPDFSHVLQIRGLLYLYGLNEYGKAMADFDAALKYNKWNIRGITVKETEPEEVPGLHTGILKFKAYAQLKLGKHLDCIATIEKALNIKPNGFVFYDPWKLDDFDHLVKKYPKDFRTWLYRGIYYDNNSFMSNNHKDLAISDYQKALKLNNRYPFTYFSIGDTYMSYYFSVYPKPADDIKYKQKAIEYFNKALKLKPSPSLGKSIYREIAIIQTDLKKYDAALAAYDKALEYSKDDGGIHVDKASVYSRMQRFDDEILEYGNALNSSIRDGVIHFGKNFTTHVYLYRGDANRKAGKFITAVDDYTNYIERKKTVLLDVGLDPYKFLDSGYFSRGQAHIELGNFNEAVDDFSNALKGFGGDSPGTYQARAQAYTRMGNYNAALDDYNRSISLSNDNRYVALESMGERGRVLMQLKRYKEAIDDFDKVLEDNPEDLNALRNRGYSYYLLGIYDQALIDFNNVLTIAPDFPEILVSRGEILLLKNNFADAMRNFTQAIAFDPKYDGAYHSRGNAYLQMGQKEKGLQDYRIAARLGNEDVKKYLQDNNLAW